MSLVSVKPFQEVKRVQMCRSFYSRLSSLCFKHMLIALKFSYLSDFCTSGMLALFNFRQVISPTIL